MPFENQPSGVTSGSSDSIQVNSVDIHSLEVMDEILRFIYKEFYQQVHPGSRKFTSAKISIPVSIDFECTYQIDIPDGILNSKAFRRKVRLLLLRSDVNTTGLLAILQGTYNALKEITVLYEDILQHKQFSQKLTVSTSFDERTCDFKFHRNPKTISRFVLFSNKDLYDFCNDTALFLHHLLFNKENIPIGSNGIPNTPLTKNEAEKPLIKSSLGSEKHKINLRLLSLTLTSGFNAPCIDSAFKDYLVMAIASIYKTGEIPLSKSRYTVRDNKQFYHAIIALKADYKLETCHIIELINCATNIDRKTIRNNLSKYRSVNKK